MSEWQPIETAPHEAWLLGWTSHGVRFIRYLEAHPNDGIPPLVAGWCTQTTYMNHVFGVSGSQIDEELTVTHWMPLPDPPQGDGI